MSKRFAIELGTIKPIALQESKDEIYILGSIDVAVKIEQEEEEYIIDRRRSGTFASPDIQIFTDQDLNKLFDLQPRGKAYDRRLPAKSRVTVTILVVQYNGASDVARIRKELDDFLARAKAVVDDIPVVEGVAKVVPLATLLGEFVQAISNIFDKDKIIGKWESTYYLNSDRGQDVTFHANAGDPRPDYELKFKVIID